MWTPNYRFRNLKNIIGKEVYRCIHVYCNQFGCELVELNIQVHEHLVVKVAPKLSVSNLMVVLKVKIALKRFNNYPHLRKKRLWFWQRGYFSIMLESMKKSYANI